VDKKVALVTGGTGGIGTHICLKLAEQGYQVVAGYLHAAAEEWQAALRAKGVEIGIIRGDVSDYTSSGQMIAETTAKFGPIAALVNNHNSGMK
jgi:acetoacetyl-CoA reductase